MIGSSAAAAPAPAPPSTARPISARLDVVRNPRRSICVIWPRRGYSAPSHVRKAFSMILDRLPAVAFFFAAAVAVTGAAAQRSPATDPWPPGVQKVPPGSPALSPADALKRFSMPPGYHVELVASEPMIQEPVAIDWDPQGRLWAVEMPGYMNEITGRNEHDPIGRVVVLEDADGDGRMDKRTVFAGRADPGAGAQGARPWRAGRRAAEHLAHARHRRRSARGYEDARHRSVRTAGWRPSEQRQRALLGARQPDVYGRAGRGSPAVEERHVRDPPDAASRRVGRGGGRRGPDLPEHERFGAARRSGAHGVLRPQSESAPDARELRAARHR